MYLAWKRCCAIVSFFYSSFRRFVALKVVLHRTHLHSIKNRCFQHVGIEVSRVFLIRYRNTTNLFAYLSALHLSESFQFFSEILFGGRVVLGQMFVVSVLFQQFNVERLVGQFALLGAAYFDVVGIRQLQGRNEIPTNILTVRISRYFPAKLASETMEEFLNKMAGYLLTKAKFVIFEDY